MKVICSKIKHICSDLRALRAIGNRIVADNSASNGAFATIIRLMVGKLGPPMDK